MEALNFFFFLYMLILCQNGVSLEQFAQNQKTKVRKYSPTLIDFFVLLNLNSIISFNRYLLINIKAYFGYIILKKQGSC